MIEKAFSLFERGVIALEKIAASSGGVNVAVPQASVEEKVAAPETETVETGYDGKSREALVELCKRRGIEIPSKTRTTTLAKMLTAADDADKLESAQTSEPETPEEEEDPFTETKEEEADPFGDDDDGVTPEVVLTVQDVRVVLKEVIEAHGNEKVFALLKSVGAGKMSEVKESDYTKLVAAAQAVLKG